MYTDTDVSKFEAKGGKKVFKGVNSVNMFCSDFFDGAGHIALDVDKGF